MNRGPRGKTSRWVPARRSDPELMDSPGLAADEVADAYRVLRRVNWMLGNNLTLTHEVARFFREESLDEKWNDASPAVLLDIGTGSGDIPSRIIRQMGYESPALGVIAIGVDRDPVAVKLCREREQSVRIVRADALRLPLKDQSVDLAMGVKFAHHFEAAGLVSLLSELARVARRRVLILDIERHWAAYWGFVLWSRVFTRNRLVRFDGPLSVLRGFRAEELLEVTKCLVEFNWVVRRYAGFQIVLVGSRADR
jgi:ubiquinone/menaquinone biosynthesis C-methylase UbiE